MTTAIKAATSAHAIINLGSMMFTPSRIDRDPHRYAAQQKGSATAFLQSTGLSCWPMSYEPDWNDRAEAASYWPLTAVVAGPSLRGFNAYEHGWFDKRFIYEESMRTPFLIQYPGHIRAGSRVTAPIQNIDYAPTFLAFAGVREPDTIQGRSLVALFGKRPATDWRKDVYYHYYEYPGFHAVRAHYGVRGERYKLIRFYSKDINSWEFYDLKIGPGRDA